MAEKRLGKGLVALFEENTIEINERGSVHTLKINDVEPDKNQPRKAFDDEKLSELASSIKQHGVIQPIVVKPIEDGRYSIVAGERRWRAARRAGLLEIPVVIREYSDREIREISLIENLQREDLNPIEEATGYKNLIEEFSLKQEEVASIIGKSRPVIANAIRILSLPNEIIEMVKNNNITAGHAKALLSIENDAEKINLAKKIEIDKLTVRDIEKFAEKKKKNTEKSEEETIEIVNIQLGEIILKIEENLSRKVKIIEKNGKGKIELEYYSQEDLSALVEFLSKDEF